MHCTGVCACTCACRACPLTHAQHEQGTDHMPAPVCLLPLLAATAARCSAAAAMFTAVCYQLLLKSSQFMSPKICKQYRRLKEKDQVDWDSRCERG